MPRYPLGGSEEFPEGVIVSRRVGDLDLIAIRHLGRIAVYLDQCTHQPVKLSEFGEINGCLLMCHAHGGVFDLGSGGAPVQAPARTGLSAFSSIEEQGQVTVII